jgi:hypothetical protein
VIPHRFLHHTKGNPPSGIGPVTSFRNSGGIQVRFLNGRFLAYSTGNPGPLYSSADGKTWRANNGDGMNSVGGVVFGGGMYWAAQGRAADFLLIEGLVPGGGAKLRSSSDGVNWTNGTAPPNAIQFLSFGTDGTRFLCHVSLSTGGTGAFWSSNATTWNAMTTPAGLASGSAFEMAHGGGVTLCVSSTRSILRTVGAAGWVEVNPSIGRVNSVVWDGTRFVAAGAEGIATSPDGAAWTFVSPVSVDVLIWNGQRFAAVVGQKSVMTTRDFTIWTYPSPVANTIIYGMAANGSNCVAVDAADCHQFELLSVWSS